MKLKIYNNTFPGNITRWEASTFDQLPVEPAHHIIASDEQAASVADMQVRESDQERAGLLLPAHQARCVQLATCSAENSVQHPQQHASC